MNKLFEAGNKQKKKPDDYDMSVVYAPEINQILRKSKDTQTGVPLWLVTFTDVMALMLTFFVLLYSMSAPDEDKWQNISAAMSSEFAQLYSKPYSTGPSDTIQIDKISSTRALDLSYLRGLLEDVLARGNFKNIMIVQRKSDLIVSLPEDILFESGETAIKAEGKQALFLVGGALNRIRNRVEVVGHSGPLPASAPVNGNLSYDSGWALSLMRAGAVSAFLREVGYNRSLVVQGLSSGRYDALPESMREEKRLDLSRRVDLVIMSDDGAQRMMMQFE